MNFLVWIVVGGLIGWVASKNRDAISGAVASHPVGSGIEAD